MQFMGRFQMFTKDLQSFLSLSCRVSSPVVSKATLIRQVRVHHPQCTPLHLLQLHPLVSSRVCVSHLTCILHDGVNQDNVYDHDVLRIDNSPSQQSPKSKPGLPKNDQFDNPERPPAYYVTFQCGDIHPGC